MRYNRVQRVSGVSDLVDKAINWFSGKTVKDVDAAAAEIERQKQAQRDASTALYLTVGGFAIAGLVLMGTLGGRK